MICNIGVYAREVLRDSPYGFWRFSERSGIINIDHGSGGNNAVNSGPSGIAVGSTGALVGDTSCGIKCNSTGSGTISASPTMLISKDRGVSYECWIRTTQTSRFTFGTNIRNIWVPIDVGVFSTGKIRANLLNTQIYDGTTDHRIYDGQWHHIVTTVGPGLGNAHLYIDSIERPLAVTSNTWGADVSLNSTFVLNGLYNAPTILRMAGDLDEVAMYDYAISASRVVAHYRAAKGLAPVRRTFTLSSASRLLSLRRKAVLV
jgi:hypothetical protein